jgi:SAM-dependent methyltransferase
LGREVNLPGLAALESPAAMLQAALDLPSTTAPSDPLTLRIQGWVHAGADQAKLVAVEAKCGELEIGRTSLLYPRPDVSAALGLPAEAKTGFSLLCSAPGLVSETQAHLAIFACFADGSRQKVAERDVTLTGRDYRKGDWGVLVDGAFPHVVQREHMYNSGPSQESTSAELLALLARYLPPAGSRIIDVGCGRGVYGEVLRAKGYDWLGIEIKPEDCAVLTQKGLPFQQVDAHHLPFESDTFDAGLCIEVLEHIQDPWSFVAEIRRTLRQRFIVSVPNLELVPYLRPHLAVPWHLLEADHRNFFSRVSLRELLRPHFRNVEVISYGQAPLRTAEGASLDYHLLAVADV